MPGDVGSGRGIRGRMGCRGRREGGGKRKDDGGGGVERGVEVSEGGRRQRWGEKEGRVTAGEEEEEKKGAGRRGGKGKGGGRGGEGRNGRGRGGGCLTSGPPCLVFGTHSITCPLTCLVPGGGRERGAGSSVVVGGVEGDTAAHRCGFCCGSRPPNRCCCCFCVCRPSESPMT